MIDFVIKDIEKRNITLNDYANLFGVTRDAVYKWKTGDTKPHIAVQVLMCLKTKEILNLKSKLKKMKRERKDVDYKNRAT